MPSITAQRAAIAADPAADGNSVRRWRVLTCLEKTAIGTRAADGVTAARRSERPGCLLYGPYWQLSAGAYRLEFRCRSGEPLMAEQPVLGVQVIALNRIQLAWLDLTAGELEAENASLDFMLPPALGLETGDEARLEFRFFHLGNADLTITAVDLRVVETHEIRLQAVTLWRMLGRLEKTAIGRRTKQGITVRRLARAGCLLDGCRPFLQLPEGHYRLELKCDVRMPRGAAQPALRVEVAPRHRWRQHRRGWKRLFGAPAANGARLAQRDFAATELVSGNAAVEFSVPPELGLEGGQEVVFDLRFVHLGNADLALRAVDLRKIFPIEARCRAPTVISGGPKRRNVVIIGNCQAQTVCEALVRSPAFNGRLNARYHFVGLQQNLLEFGRAELEDAEILLVQDIQDWERYPLRSCLREDVRIVKFPLLHFASLWPFDHYNGPGDKEAYEREWPNLTFLYHDGLLARLRKEIPDREQRLAAYRALEIDGVVNFVRLHDFERRRLLAMDKRFGFEIGKFILDHFQRRRLFYTTNHPNSEIFTMLMQYLLDHLGIDQIFRSAAILDHLQPLQVPVHPKVAKALGVRWADEHTKYVYRGEEITWEAYVRRYIDHYG